MVFHCRCFSFLLEEDIEYETRTPAKSTATDTFYTAPSDLNRPEHLSHANSINSAEKRGNLRVFTVAELNTATNNFSTAIGKGGFGTVYKGVIKRLDPPFGKIYVAVKRSHGLLLQGHKEWDTEIDVLGAVEHPNLVKLIGYCVDDNKRSTRMLLVYEFMVNGSVEDHLYAESKTPLSWNMRLKVAQDAARGLTYLHEEMDAVQIVLRNFKPSNILLDDQWNAKLEDFRLALLRHQEENSHVLTSLGVGTEGYIAPEYFIEGQHASKSDVWSYGVFLYELITGRRPLDTNRPLNEHILVEWVKPYIESKRFNQLVDPRILEGNYPLKSAEKLSIIANKCLSANPKSRPKMSEVLEMVNQLIMVPSQATSLASPQVPQVAVDPNKAFVGQNQGGDTKQEGQNGSIRIQHKKPACLPWIRPLKLLKSCSKKLCCV